MGEFSDAVAVVYPAEWDRAYTGKSLPELHSTILYLGRFEDISYSWADVVEGLKLVNLNFFQFIDISGKAMFGPEAETPVLTLDKPFLFQTQVKVEQALNRVGIFNASEFPYNPHITVDEQIFNNPPKNVLLKPAELWWGDERIKLNG